MWRTGEPFTSANNADGDRGLAEAEWETISYWSHTLHWASWGNSWVWAACSSVRIYLLTLLQATLRLLPLVSLMFFLWASSPPSGTESLTCPCCTEEFFWVSSSLAGSVWFLPLDKTQKPGAKLAVQPERPTKSAGSMTQLRATSLNHINQLWWESEMRAGGKVRREENRVKDKRL